MTTRRALLASSAICRAMVSGRRFGKTETGKRIAEERRADGWIIWDEVSNWRLPRTERKPRPVQTEKTIGPTTGTAADP